MNWGLLRSHGNSLRISSYSTIVDLSRGTVVAYPGLFSSMVPLHPSI
jgi:hypothetical protein